MKVGPILSFGICPDCDVIMTHSVATNDLHACCTQCYGFCGSIRNEDACCMIPDLHLVRYYIKDGRVQLRKQCQNCHTISGPSISQKGLDLNSIPVADTELEIVFKKKREMEFLEFKTEFNQLFTEHEKESALLLESKFDYKKYKLYLLSDQWKAKRKKVLERDKNTCQSCLSAKADQVHHITYKHLMDEPLFELVSVCQPCHENITRMDKGEYYSTMESKLYQNLLS